MSGHVLFAQSFAQLMRDALGQPSRIHEPSVERCAFTNLHDALVNLIPHFVRGDGAQFGRRNLDAKIELALVANVDDHRLGARILWISIAREKMRNLFNRLLRRRKADAHRRVVSQRFEALQRQR